MLELISYKQYAMYCLYVTHKPHFTPLLSFHQELETPGRCKGGDDVERVRNTRQKFDDVGYA